VTVPADALRTRFDFVHDGVAESCTITADTLNASVNAD
jgi:hypothetical protein